jgi:hypothetical protein
MKIDMQQSNFFQYALQLQNEKSVSLFNKELVKKALARDLIGKFFIFWKQSKA